MRMEHDMNPNRKQRTHPLAIAGAVILILLLAAAIYVAIQNGYSTTGENLPGGQPSHTSAPQHVETPESAKPLRERDSGGLGKAGLGQ
jgi:hypothetical protein